MSRAHLIFILGITLYGGLARADDRLQLDKTTILGNRELPKVTFVVPWRDVPGDIPAWQPSPASRPFAIPLDEELYRRWVAYLRQLNKPRDGGQAR